LKIAHVCPVLITFADQCVYYRARASTGNCGAWRRHGGAAGGDPDGVKHHAPSAEKRPGWMAFRIQSLLTIALRSARTCMFAFSSLPES
jgi:hypothetical protein